MTCIGSEAVPRPAAGDWLTPGHFAALLALLILAMFPDVLLGGRTFIFRDFSAFGYPLAYHYRESFWHGELPLWNPLSHCGLPFLAQWNTLVLYPGSLLYLLLPLEWSLGFFNLLHLFLCGMAMYALAWNWTGNRLAATLAGLAFAFNGFTLNCLMWPNYIASLAWMPLVVLTVERAWRLGGRHLVLGALAGAMQMLSGTPEVILLTWLLLVGLWFLQLTQHAGPRGKGLFRLVCVVALVTGLAAAQLLPFLDLLHFSERGSDAVADEWAMPLTGWANLLVPLFRMGQSSAGVYYQADQGITSSYYLGIGTVVLALIAVWRGRQARVVLLGAITAACLWLALGRAGGAYTLLLKAFPPLAFMRFPIKFVILPVLLVPLLAAYALAAFLEGTPETKRRFERSGLIVSLLCLLAIGAVVTFAGYRPFPREVWRTTALSGLTRAGFLVAILGLCCALGRAQAPRAWVVLGLSLMALTWLDTNTHVPRQNPTVERQVYQPGILMAARPQPEPSLGKSRAMLSLEAILAHRDKVLTNAAAGYFLQRLALYNNANLLEAIPKVDGFFALRLREEAEVRSRLYLTTNSCREALADFLSVSQVTCATNLFAWSGRPAPLSMITAGQQPAFLEGTNILAALSSADFDPRKVVFLRPTDKPNVSVTHQSAARILSTHWSSHHVDILAEAEEPALVVIAQSYYRNWHAYVADRRVPLLRANYAFQALEIPAGRQQITLKYEDRAFYWGTMISLASTAVLGALWVRAGRQPVG
jgi:hypothetical protein